MKCNTCHLPKAVGATVVAPTRQRPSQCRCRVCGQFTSCRKATPNVLKRVCRCLGSERSINQCPVCESVAIAFHNIGNPDRDKRPYETDMVCTCEDTP